MNKRTLFIIAITLSIAVFSQSVLAATNISSNASEHWAWNDIVGWMDFYNTLNVQVAAHDMVGYASSSANIISLNCADFGLCGTSNYYVENDGTGVLTGWAWNDAYGWISMSCQNTGTCGAVNYGVTIDGVGDFSGWAWNDLIGWISFNCADVPPSGICGTSNYKVKTSWVATSTTGYVDSTTYDTQNASGSQMNAIIWHGDLPAGTDVRFQFAMSNSSSGPWAYVGPDGTANTYYSDDPDVSITLDYNLFNNYRYLRYRTTLVSNQAQTLTPRVDDVVIVWSP